MKIIIESIPHCEQRYETVGDWQVNGNTINVRVSRMQDDYDFLVGIHEAIEAYLCVKRGVTPELVDAFDTAFEEARADGNEDEPGDDPNAPYRKEHFFATSVERLLAAELGVDWSEYDKAINAL